MTERLYYSDSYCQRFETRVTERLEVAGHPAVVLDQTCFYPTSGGQPHDTGSLNGRSVLDVVIRESDGAVLHILDAPLPENSVSGQIDWARRFDHMQHHTGQHILSQAFIRLAEAETVGFHLGGESVTIDLDSSPTEALIRQAERLANEIVWQDRPVQARIVNRNEAQDLPLRKIPDVTGDALRLVEIDAFDLTACGGTHVARTGAVGLVKIIGLENRSGGLRVDFRCGRRALDDYDEKHTIVARLAADFTTGYWEVETAVARLRDENKASRRLIKQQETDLIQFEAERYWQVGRKVGDLTIVTHAFAERDGDAMRRLANALTKKPGTVALLGTAGESARLVFCRAPDAPGAMNELLQTALDALGGGRGGGSLTFAQGGGPPTDQERVAAALVQAESALTAVLTD